MAWAKDRLSIKPFLSSKPSALTNQPTAASNLGTQSGLPMAFG
jgi:hypothetical protein